MEELYQIQMTVFDRNILFAIISKTSTQIFKEKLQRLDSGIKTIASKALQLEHDQATTLGGIVGTTHLARVSTNVGDTPITSALHRYPPAILRLGATREGTHFFE
ncbi:hypothetical protein RF11_03556 [Thelohanellus kitauei]|uniref:Uncharacterized protein n=1 Tax=Thelohanellus kitauei TaxID=669202 RepID=A0A0C2JIT7_THEKT|nr:hypothetical protein RF11_03556 [Thelohanellus kitauei]